MKKIYLLMLGLTGIAGSLTPQTLNDYRTKSAPIIGICFFVERLHGTNWVMLPRRLITTMQPSSP